jgi:hypothetical protein
LVDNTTVEKMNGSLGKLRIVLIVRDQTDCGGPPGADQARTLERQATNRF